MQYALVFIPGLVIGRLFDMGIYKMPIFLASVMLVVCTILVAQCKEYWQFLLCQGIAVGVSNFRTILHAVFSLQWLARLRCYLRTNARRSCALVQAQERTRIRCGRRRLEWRRDTLPHRCTKPHP